MHPLLSCAALACLLPLATLAAEPPDLERGKALHETHCVLCHDASPYQRTARLAKDYASLRDQVRRWQDNSGLQWSAADIEAVTAHLALTWYGFALPAAR